MSASMERLYLCDGCGKDVWVVMSPGVAPDAIEARGDVTCCGAPMWHRAMPGKRAPQQWPSGLPTWVV